MTPAQLAASLAPLIDRVRRDVTAVKRQGAQAWTREPLTPERLLDHITGAGPSRGVSQIEAGQSSTRVAVLDLDSHGGETPWREMVATAERLMDTLQLLGGEPIPWRSSGGRGIHLYLLWDEPQDAYSVRDWLRAALAGSGLKNGTKGVAQGQCEVFPKQDSVPADGFGNQCVLPLAGASVPLVFEELAGEWVVGSRDDALGVEWRVSEPVPRAIRPERVVRVTSEMVGYEVLRELLDAIPVDDLEYEERRNIMFALHHETGGSDVGLQLLHDFRSRGGLYNPEKHDKDWASAHSEGRGAVIGLGTLQHIAARYGWVSVPVSADAFDDVSAQDSRPPLPASGSGAGVGLAEAGAAAREARAEAEAQQAARVHALVNGGEGGAGGGGAEPPAQRRAGDGGRTVPVVKRRGIPEAHHLTTDQANANRLVNAFGRLVFVAAGRWHVWDGKRWLADEADVYRYGCQLSDIIRSEAVAIKAKASVQDGLAQQKAAEIAAALMKWAVKSEMKGTIEAAIGLARKMLTVEADLLDRDAYALNVANGIVDLRTGRLRPHNPDELITKLVPVAYRPEAVAPTWEKVLREITREDGGQGSAGGSGGGAAPVAAFLARWFGYCLTGVVTEQVFVVHWGSGSNGKSTVLGLMADTLGDYAGTAAPGLMAASKNDRHPTEIASLMGRRMVTAHESAENVVLREDFIKQATGDDRMEARFMRGDFFGFAPTHKLQLLTNHKPQVKGTDPGIWRRVLLVPYVASFGSAEQVAAGTHTGLRDVGLVERLRGELEGVLAWRVRGAVEWAQGGGLIPPAVVRIASAAYRSEQDRVGQFVAECCERGAAWLAPLTDTGSMDGGLYPAYVGWCKEGGTYPLSKARFTEDVLRVVGAGATVERKSSAEVGKRRKLTCVPGLRLIPEG